MTPLDNLSPVIELDKCEGNVFQSSIKAKTVEFSTPLQAQNSVLANKAEKFSPIHLRCPRPTTILATAIHGQKLEKAPS